MLIFVFRPVFVFHPPSDSLPNSHPISHNLFILSSHNSNSQSSSPSSYSFPTLHLTDFRSYRVRFRVTRLTRAFPPSPPSHTRFSRFFISKANYAFFPFLFTLQGFFLLNLSKRFQKIANIRNVLVFCSFNHPLYYELPHTFVTEIILSYILYLQSSSRYYFSLTGFKKIASITQLEE